MKKTKKKIHQTVIRDTVTGRFLSVKRAKRLSPKRTVREHIACR